MKFVIAIVVLVAVGLWPPLLIPVEALLHGCAAVLALAASSWSVVLLGLAAGAAHHVITRRIPRVRVIRGRVHKEA